MIWFFFSFHFLISGNMKQVWLGDADAKSLGYITLLRLFETFFFYFSTQILTNANHLLNNLIEWWFNGIWYGIWVKLYIFFHWHRSKVQQLCVLLIRLKGIFVIHLAFDSSYLYKIDVPLTFECHAIWSMKFYQYNLSKTNTYFYVRVLNRLTKPNECSSKCAEQTKFLQINYIILNVIPFDRKN